MNRYVRSPYHLIVTILLIIAAGFFTGSCSRLLTQKVDLPAVLNENIAHWKGHEFAQRIKQMEIIAELHPNEAVREKAAIKLTAALLHPDNPSPDYRGALNRVEMMQESTGRTASLPVDAITLLKIIVELEQENLKLNSALARLQTVHQKNLSTQERQKALIQKLRNEIEKLDMLLLKIEEKRQRKKDQ